MCVCVCEHIYIYIYIKVFANDLGDRGSILGRIIPKTFKNGACYILVYTQQYKVRVKGKVEQSRKRSCALPLHFSVVAIEKGVIWSPSTTVANFTFIKIHILSLSLTHTHIHILTQIVVLIKRKRLTHLSLAILPQRYFLTL